MKLNEDFTIVMSKYDMLKYYTNKIIEDGIRECSEFNISLFLTDYGDGIDLSKYKDDIIQLLYRDERIADVTIDDELTIDMVFWTSYCPYYYDEINGISNKSEIKILSDFYYFSSSQIFQESCLSIRMLLNNFIDSKISDNQKEEKEKIYNILKKNIVKTGFIDKFIENNNETYVTLKNKKEFEDLLKTRINELEKQAENEEQEEFE